MNYPKTKKNIHAVILCGGFGERLWPLSDSSYPKQFIKFHNKPSLLQQLIIRLNKLKKLVKLKSFIFLCNEELRFLLLQQIAETKLKINFSIILEPVKKNTAPALTMASIHVEKKYNSKDIMLVLPSDHFINDDQKFIETIKSIISKSINENKVGLLGIPTSLNSPEYGYLVEKNNNKKFKDLFIFLEKPNKTKINLVRKENNIYINSGIFILSSNFWQKKLKESKVSIFDKCFKSYEKSKSDGFFIRPEKAIFSKIEDISIDFALFNLNKHIVEECFFVAVNFKWEDLGSFEKIQMYLNAKSADNNLIYSSSNKKIIIENLKNCMVVEKNGRIYVSKNQNPSNLSNDEKKIQEQDIYFRPWGSYKIIERGKNFIVKKLCINPKSSLSLQYHNYRSEHWVVVEGEALIQKGNKTLKLKKNESTYIQKKEIHRISNLTNKNLTIIEVQSGAKLIESDIKRLDDVYNR